ncbi:alcohol dehydrogenase catalytic domain-containing protein [Iodidimonas sp. SYSU 1G8]|uniref:alcohol dehydrogenase catalytic domain-containing protein n=1 Tax=Iodidimonas sp. SYSU 1G8 TaxID=3133967 RepID=UPI0031FF16E6
MKAAVFLEVGKPLAIETIADPTPQRGEVIIRVKHCGICGTDLHATEQHGLPRGTVMGHEFAGEVVAIGPDVPQGWKEGDRLCTLPFIGCGQCLACYKGTPWQCETKQIIGLGALTGGFAEYTRVHLNEAVKLPASVSWKEGALVEPLAVSLHGVRGIRNGLAGKNVLVIGAGPIGLTTVLWCKFFGARHVIVSELDQGRAQMSLRYGATGLVDAAGDVGEQFRELTGAPPELIIECVGVPGMIAKCVELAPYGAEILVVGFCSKPDTIMPALAMAKELTMRFVVAHDKSDFQFVVDMIAANRIDVEHMVTDVVSFGELPGAFEALRTPTSQCKVLLDPAL